MVQKILELLRSLYTLLCILYELYLFYVYLAGFFDGFLIGVACSLSRRAALILALANCLGT